MIRAARREAARIEDGVGENGAPRARQTGTLDPRAMKKTPRRLAFDDRTAALSRLERFVLSRVDGRLSVSEIARTTGLAGPQVEQIVGRLEARGAIALDETSGETGSERSEGAPLANVGPTDPGEVSRAIAGDDPSDADDFAVPVSRPRSPNAPASSSWRVPSAHEPPELEAPAIAEPGVEDPPSVVSLEGEGDAADPNDEGSIEIQNYRKLYETTLRHLPPDERLTKARSESGPVLYALSFDQEPQIIKGVLENDRVNLDHARLIAANHRNPVGLEALCARASILQDARVQRALLRNVQLTETLMRRILQPKRLLEIYKASLDRDVPDRTRIGARALLKTKFQVASPEEKFEIVWTTEGRVLPLLLGQTLDQKTTALFCGRNFASVMLIQSFARWPATPPGILAHILRQPLVLRQAHLRNMILQHPNVPSEVKRKI